MVKEGDLVTIVPQETNRQVWEEWDTAKLVAAQGYLWKIVWMRQDTDGTWVYEGQSIATGEEHSLYEDEIMPLEGNHG